MDYTYRIANKTICLQSDIELIEKEESALFRIASEEVIDMKVRIYHVDELPKVEGDFVAEALDTKLYRKNEKLFLITKNRKDDSPIFFAEFSSLQKDKIILWALKSEMPHTLRIQVIWSAINLPYHMLLGDVLTLHSSVIEIGKKTIVFFAPSGTGKSTQANLWYQYRNAKQLNGDKTALLCKEEGIYACGLPFCGTSEICNQYELPLNAMVFLSQAKKNVIRSMTGMEALKALLDNCFGYTNVSGCMLKMIEIASKILENVPIYALACTPDENAVICLEEQLRKDNRYDNFVQSVD